MLLVTERALWLIERKRRDVYTHYDCGLGILLWCFNSIRLRSTRRMAWASKRFYCSLRKRTVLRVELSLPTSGVYCMSIHTLWFLGAELGLRLLFVTIVIVVT
jgi:hypothetical protein